jgi:hypothetical protein
MTLKDLLAQHPEWAELEIAVIDTSGILHFIDQSGAVYESEDDTGPVLVFATN